MKKIAMMLALTALTLGGSLPAQENLPSVPLGRPQRNTPTPTPPVATAPGGVRQRPAPAQPGRPAQTPRVQQNGQTRQAPPPAAAQQPRPGVRAGAPTRQQAPAQAQAPQQLPPQGQAQAQPTPAPTPANVNIQIGVKLERVRVQRSRLFTAAAPEASPSEDPSAWANEMAMQMRLTTARDWDVIEVSEATIRQALDQNGQALTGMKPLAAPGQNPAAGVAAFVPPFHITNSGATLLVRTLPPPAGVQVFKQLDARIRATMGYRRTVTIKDARSMLNGPSLTRNSGVDDVVVQVSAVDKTKVDLTGLGAIERVGPIRFEDAAGREIVPYNSETELKDVPPSASATAQRAKEWRFDFSRLPEKFNIVMTLYPIIMPRSLTVTFKDVPLP